MDDKTTDSTRQTRDREEFIASIRQIVAGDDHATELLDVATWLYDLRETDPQRARALVDGIYAEHARHLAEKEAQR